jgi:pimeloyl-[acyl-carrier protein] methyl ester esterase
MQQLKTIDCSTISYSDQGSGYPVLFLHGWMMSRKAWYFQLPLLSEFRIITIDLRGHGESEASSFSYDKCLSDICYLLDQLKIDNLVVVGWSLGSQIAIKSFRLLKERLSGLVLVGGTPCFCNKDEYTCGLPPVETRGMEIRLKRDYKGTANSFFNGMFSGREKASINLPDIAAKTVSILSPIEISLSALQELNITDLRQALSDISIPVLIIHGEEDHICPPGAAKFMAAHLPLAEMRLIPAAGHAPFISTPEIFNNELKRFIRTVHGQD